MPWATEAAGSRSACVLTPRSETQKTLCAASSRCRKASAWRLSFPSAFRKKKRPRTMLPARQNGPASPRRKSSISDRAPAVSPVFSQDRLTSAITSANRRGRRLRDGLFSLSCSCIRAVSRSFFRIQDRFDPAADHRTRAAKASATARMSSGSRLLASFTISSGIP